MSLSLLNLGVSVSAKPLPHLNSSPSSSMFLSLRSCLVKWDRSQPVSGHGKGPCRARFHQKQGKTNGPPERLRRDLSASCYKLHVLPSPSVPLQYKVDLDICAGKKQNMIAHDRLQRCEEHRAAGAQPDQRLWSQRRPRPSSGPVHEARGVIAHGSSEVHHGEAHVLPCPGWRRAFLAFCRCLFSASVGRIQWRRPNGVGQIRGRIEPFGELLRTP